MFCHGNMSFKHIDFYLVVVECCSPTQEGGFRSPFGALIPCECSINQTANTSRCFTSAVWLAKARSPLRAMHMHRIYGFTVVSLLAALLHTYSGGEGMNIITNINAPVTVIHSK